MTVLATLDDSSGEHLRLPLVANRGLQGNSTVLDRSEFRYIIKAELWVRSHQLATSYVFDPVQCSPAERLVATRTEQGLFSEAV